MDYQLSANNSVFGRYMATTYLTPPPYELIDNLLATQRSGFDNLSQAFAVGNTYLLGANTVNSFRVAINRNALQRTHKDYFSGADLGVKMYDGYMPDYMILTVTGGPSLGGGTQNRATFRTTTYQVAEDLSLIRGPHQMAFGANMAHWRNNVNANVASSGSFNFNGTATGLGMADFLTGRLTTLTQAAPNVVHDQQWYFGFFGQDTWRTTPNLTLNYGLRWEPWFPAQIVDGRIYHFDEDAFYAGVKSTIFRNAPAGFSYPGDPGFPGQAGMNPRWTNFGPRVGLAWDVKGDGRTSVRASFSRAYDFVPGQYHINTVIANPWGARITANSPSGGFDDPWTIAGGNPFPFAFDVNAAFAPNGTYNNFNYDSKTTTVDAWSLAVQRQIGESWLVSGSYIGNHTIHLWTSREQNAAVYYPGSNCMLPSGQVVSGTCSTTGNIHDRRKYVNARPDGRGIGSIGIFEDGGTARYNGLLLSVQRRAASGVSVSANYTWSHCYGDVTQVTGTPNGGTYQGDRFVEAGNCDTDRRHLFNSTAVIDTPQFVNPTLRALATGWKVSGIFRRATGSYFTVTSGTDIALTGIGNQRPNQVLENPYLDKSSATKFLNPAAFLRPATGTVGNMRRMNIAGASTFQFDMALSRGFQIRESQRLELRAEAFNVTNSMRRGGQTNENPESSLNSAQFGQFTSAKDPRILQFAVKYVF
jgi:outer membrane receptor protein involved in Fe transport